MFKFFFKRAPKPVSVLSQADAAPQKSTIAKSGARKEAAFEQALALAGNEAEAVTFILQNEFADARLKAAEHIHSKAQLERIAHEMRNTDRRVVKLMRQRLAAIVDQERQEQGARLCIEFADKLIAEHVLIPSHLVELDRNWTAIDKVAEPTRDLFSERRNILQQKLEKQLSLQRRALELRTQLIDLNTRIGALPATAPVEQFINELDNLERETAECCTADAAASLPKHLITDFSSYAVQAGQTLNTLQQRRENLQRYEEKLAEWEAAAVNTYQADSLRRTWRSLPALPEEDSYALNLRFDALIARIPTSEKPKKTKKGQEAVLSSQPDNTAVLGALEAMEQALADGALQLAGEHAKVVQGINPKSLNLSNEQLVRLSHARQELARLKGWARWGGNISREELVKTAEELPGKEVDIAELAKKVGSLRSHWKSMDMSAGPASKELWSRFDTACTAAYAPVAEHFSKLAKERKENLERAHALVAEIKAYAKSQILTDQAKIVDWKKAANQRMQFIHAWRKIGPIDRKDRKVIEVDFNEAMRLIIEPLTAQQQHEISRREALIAQATQLDPTDRNAIEQLRLLQEEWQRGAKLLPLERADEQALWQRFRAACDGFFEQRKALGQEADLVRQQNLQDKETLCSMLESAVHGPNEAISPLLTEANTKWRAIGAVSRESESHIHTRYHNAVSALQAKLAATQQLANTEQFRLVRDKLKLCCIAEQKASLKEKSTEHVIPVLQEQWRKMEALPKDLECGMQLRFNSALDAILSGNHQYAAQLKDKESILERNLLRLEVLLETESPAELSAERLKLQVEALQSSLKTGGLTSNPRSVLLELCATPASMSEKNWRRTECLLEKWRH